MLPAFCPERHINEDGSFCLGFRAGRKVHDIASAENWWKKLHVFLLCQETAEETGVWPKALQISHGEAGELELEAEEVAESLGLLDAYREAVRYNGGMIARYLRRVRAGTYRLFNGRAACVCGRRNRRGVLRLRRQCRKRGDPCLPVMEVRRREAERRFWQRYSSKVACCGRMRECPLKGDSAPSKLSRA
jgi:hypothetical protein